jgi:hypothetical protein
MQYSVAPFIEEGQDHICHSVVPPKPVTARLQQAIENSLKSVKIFQGCTTTDHEINVNDVILHELYAVFDEHGTLVQPTSHNNQN